MGGGGWCGLRGAGGGYRMPPFSEIRPPADPRGPPGTILKYPSFVLFFPNNTYGAKIFVKMGLYSELGSSTNQFGRPKKNVAFEKTLDLPLIHTIIYNRVSSFP